MCESVLYLFCTRVILSVFIVRCYASIQFLYLSQAGLTPLHLAAAKGHLVVCKLLCQYGADLSVTSKVSISL